MKIRGLAVILACVIALMAFGCQVKVPMKEEAVTVIGEFGDTRKTINVVGINKIAQDFIIQESEQAPLLTSVVSEDVIEKVAGTICFYSRSSTAPEDIFGVDKMSSIKELRPIRLENTNYYYCIYEKQAGGRLYAFFYSDFFMTGAVVYAEKQLTFSDFNVLKEGVSTRNDVVDIDSSITANIQQYSSKIDYTKDNVTFHMTLEGFVEIQYSKKENTYIVKRVTDIEDKLIQSINKNDLVQQ